MRSLSARIGVLAACLLAAAPVFAQDYPTRQIRLVVPFAAGGPADLLGRVIANEMSKDLGQQVFVDNRPGANTIIGAEFAAKAAPTSINDAGTFLTPAAVLMSTGNTARRVTMNSLAASPRPNQRTTSGMIAMRGVAYSALISQSVAASTRR